MMDVETCRRWGWVVPAVLQEKIDLRIYREDANGG